ncbi:MAG: trypsin-like peptidase domain-containing protein [Pirellulaceae bacterium]|nr:trypsin-like peptidase domain-containing protein [Pirellulaceae bacterium]
MKNRGWIAVLIWLVACSSGQGDEVSQARALSRAFRASAEKALPSVVTILTRSRSSGGEDSPLLNLIGGADAQVYDSVGSGVIISPDGWILTNHHVIADAIRLEVRLPDGRRFFPEKTLSDESSDVALVKIESTEDVPAAEIGNSNELAVGDWVIAIGSPFTLESSVSAGIISGINRRRSLSRGVEGQFLQTDAAVNPGNSGGPLLDLEGRVVGINTAISSLSGGFQGIGFAIPIARAMWIKQELQTYGKVRQALAGIRVATVSYDDAKQLNLPQLSGVTVVSTVPGRPGEAAGILAGDVILTFAGHKVGSDTEFASLVQQSPIDQPLTLEVFRNGEKLELTIQLQEKP